GDPQIDLAHLESGDLEAEIKTAERKVLQLLGQQPVVPGRDLGQPVIGDHEGADLRWRQIIKANNRKLGHPERRRRLDTTMPGDYVELGIDQHRHIETKGLDALDDLPDLRPAVTPWVRGVRFQSVDWLVCNGQAGRLASALRVHM